MRSVFFNPKLYQGLIDAHCSRIEFHKDQAEYEATFFAAPEGPRNLFAANWVRHEVENGGFGQLFANSTGRLAPEGAVAFHAMGMARAAAVVEEAMAIFGPEYPRDREARFSGQNPSPATKSVKEFLAFGRGLPSDIDLLERMFFLLLKRENGGFREAANRYAEAWRRAEI